MVRLFSRLTHEIDDLRLKLQHTLTELQAAKAAHDQQLLETSSLSEQLSLTESRLHESRQGKSSLELELRSKADLEMQVLELERQVVEQSRLADSYQDERRQRLELEGKVRELGGEREQEGAALRCEAQREKQQRCDLEFKLQELEQVLDDAKVDGETLQQSAKGKVSGV